MSRLSIRLAVATLCAACAAAQALYASPDAFELMFEGQRLVEAGKYEEAVAKLESALALDTESAFVLSQLGLAHAKSGDPAKAISRFKEVLKLDPADSFARTWLGILTQRPVNRERPSRPPTPLEKEALAEEKRILVLLEKDNRGLDLRIDRIVIDAGHGGFDSGAEGPGGLAEKDVTLSIAKKLQARFDRASTASAFLTRRGDYYLTLSERTTIANQVRADLFISIHINAAESPQAHGMETYFCSEKASSAEAARVAEFENAVGRGEEIAPETVGRIDIEDILFRFERKRYWEDSGSFAAMIQQGMNEHLPLRNRGVQSANFFVLRNAKLPSLLVEAGFISNPKEEGLLRDDDFIEKIALAVFEAIEGYRGGAR